MKKELEVLMSVMNLRNQQEFYEKIKQNKITTKVLVVNQIEEDKEIFNYKNENKTIYSFKEKGASKSRNRLIEKATGDICIFADDDMVYNEGYEKIILDEFEKNKDAEIIIFNIKNINKNREKIKKIRNKKINILDIMKVRSSQIAFRKEIIKKYNISFDENFGPNSIFEKGEETIFLADCLKKKIKIISRNVNIGNAYNYNSTWFTGFNEKYLYDQGAIFYRNYNNFYKIYILQYIFRKYKLYKNNVTLINAYKQMKAGALECKKLYEGKKYE